VDRRLSAGIVVPRASLPGVSFRLRRVSHWLTRGRSETDPPRPTLRGPPAFSRHRGATRQAPGVGQRPTLQDITHHPWSMVLYRLPLPPLVR